MCALSPSPSLNLDVKSNSLHEFAVCRAFAESLAVKADGSGEWERRLLMQQNGANLLLVARLNLSGSLNIYVAKGRVGGMGRSSELLHLTDTYGAVSLERVVRGSRAVVGSQSLVSQSLQSTETQVVTVPMSVMDFTLPLIPQVTSGS